MGTEGGAGATFGSGNGGSGRTLALPLPLDLSLSLDPSPSRLLESVPFGDADVGVGGSGCVGGGDSGGPRVMRCCAERGRGRRGASMSSELKSACDWQRRHLRARKYRDLRGCPRSRAYCPSYRLAGPRGPGGCCGCARGWTVGRAGGSGGSGLFEGGGGGRGELGSVAVVSVGSAAASSSVETGCCAARRLCARRCHSTVKTTNRETPRTVGSTIAAASTPPEGLLGCRWVMVQSRGKSGLHTHEDDFVVFALLSSVYPKIIRRGDMLAGKWERNRGDEPRASWGKRLRDGRGERERVGGNKCWKAGSDRNMIPAPGAEVVHQHGTFIPSCGKTTRSREIIKQRTSRRGVRRRKK
ncbi:hypothetical protein H4582DRAFT_1012970 [Lactarius indigo]|nr:hypothetical protein H4582DRAFT_1012970 [Lactarius indigo]